ncbi:MAG: hypothetical protein AAFV29_08585, partial [Myxococcota bacterium]
MSLAVPTVASAESSGVEIFSLPDEVAFPEGVAATRRGTLFIGSLTTGAIAKIRPNSTEGEVWLPSGTLDGAVGLAVDQRRQVLWVCESVPTQPDASTLVGFDLRTREVVARHALPLNGPAVFCNDVVVDRRGDIFLTESSLGQVFRIDRRDALTDSEPELWSADPLLAPVNAGGFGANGLLVNRREVFVVNFDTASLVRIPRQGRRGAGEGRVIPLFDDTGHPTSLTGPDGLAFTPDGD